MNKLYLLITLNLLNISCSSIPERCLDECSAINQKVWIYDIQEDKCYCKLPLDNASDKFNRKD